MAIIIQNTSTEIIVYNDTTKDITYVPKSGTTVSAVSGNVVITNGGINYVNATPNDISTPSVNGLFNLVNTLHGYLEDNPINLFSGGWGDYTDTHTSGTPITLTGGAGFIQLTNNKGIYNESALPYGVTTLWNSSTNVISLLGLSIGDIVGVRATLVATIATSNTELDIELAGGASGAAFTVPIGKATNYKTAKAYSISAYTEFYIGSTDVLENGVMIKASAEKTCSVIVTGWYIKAVKVGNA
tara:strand:- start:888 stop:1616 length:729 start_codon:yes stop_codon:yes gene_type:complete